MYKMIMLLHFYFCSKHNESNLIMTLFSEMLIFGLLREGDTFNITSAPVVFIEEALLF